VVLLLPRLFDRAEQDQVSRASAAQSPQSHHRFGHLACNVDLGHHTKRPCHGQRKEPVMDNRKETKSVDDHTPTKRDAAPSDAKQEEQKPVINDLASI